MDIPHDQGYSFFVFGVRFRAEFSAEAVDPEVSPAGREVGGRNLSKVKGHKTL